MLTWIYDEFGCGGAILDEFCIRDLSGNTVGWVFGLSVFSLKGDHVGWFEDGVLYDIENKVLGFVPQAPGMTLDMPALAPEPAMPVFSKRPYVPGLRGRCQRPRGGGWSAQSLGSVFALNHVPLTAGVYLPRLPAHLQSGGAHRP